MAVLASTVQGSASRNPVLRNDHLTVTFRPSADGPRLSQIEHCATGEVYRFERSEVVVMAIVDPEQVHDPKAKVRYALQNGFTFEGAELARDGTRAVLRFGHPLLRIDVAYQLHPDAPVIQKTTVCTGGAKGAYVAGINQWLVKPAGLTMAWPRSGTHGQPAVVLGGAGGYFLTLEWPRARAVSIQGDVRLGCRPGYEIAAGKSREVGAGAIGFFERPNGSDREAALEAARRAFFVHVADRVRPQLPFPIKFTTWGPWFGHAREDRLLEIMDDLAYIGTDICHFDAGWQREDHPYSQHLPRARNGDDATWDREMTQPDRLPNGLLPIVRAAKEHGMVVSLWFDACGNVFVRESEEWAIRDRKGQPVYGRMWCTRWPEAPRQSLAGEYGDVLKEFVLEAMKRYDLGGIMFDNNHYTPDFGPGRRSVASGWNAVDVQLRQILEILDEGERRRPGVYRFYCSGQSWPWALKHATHIHAGDPGTSGLMRKAVATDYPARAVAFERRLAWQRHYDNFVPPWGVKGDIAGWSLQQYSPIPVNLKHTGQLIPAGEGWTQNMFTCFATTAVRDIRFSFRQMPGFDREILREWLAWDRERTPFVMDCRPVLKAGDDPNEGIDGYSHVAKGRGVIYLFNRSFDLVQAEVALDERAGFRPGDIGLPAFLVYPLKAPLGSGKLSYGDTLRVPIIGKDCAVVEIGLAALEGLTTYGEYERAACSVRRSHDTLFLVDARELFAASEAGAIRVEVGSSPRDRRLATQILEALEAVSGHRITLDECLRVTAANAKCRLIIGTHEGLLDHEEIGPHFRETLYSRYVAWGGELLSAPVLAKLSGGDSPSFCLIAPRPEQLARLAMALTSEVLAGAQVHGDPTAAKGVSSDVAVAATTLRERAVLRFRPVVQYRGHVPLPGDMETIRFQVHAELEGQRTLLWRDDVPPFCCTPGAQWWQDRVVSLADFAGQSIRLHLTAAHVDGRGHERLAIGFDRVAILALRAPSR